MVRVNRLLPAFLAGAALLAGCGGPQSLLAATGAAQNSAAAQKAVRHPSWMEPGLASKELLYVSDNGGNVYVFSYPAGKLVGTLTDARSPSGLCSDKAGHVFVPDVNNEDVLEYAHGGKKPIATINDFGFYPESCAIDPTTQNLAVTNYVKPPSLGPGSVSSIPTRSPRQRNIRMPTLPRICSAATIRRAISMLTASTPARRKPSSPNCPAAAARSRPFR